jgi:hypothetical protein
MGVKKKEEVHTWWDAEKSALTEQRQERPLEGSIKGVKIEKNRNKIQDIRRVPRHKRSIREIKQNALQPRINSTFNPSSRTLASRSEVDPIVISDNDEIVSNEETPSDMIRAEVDWHRRHRTNPAGNLWSVKSLEDGQNGFDYGDMGNWNYNDKSEAAW